MSPLPPGAPAAPPDLVLILHRVGSPEAIALRGKLLDEAIPLPQTKTQQARLRSPDTARGVALPIPKRPKSVLNHETEELRGFGRLSLKERKKILARKRQTK